MEERIKALREALIKAERVAALTGAVVAEINLEETPNSGMMDFVLMGKSGEILPKLLEQWT
jgi:NAD-dependent SIR2 family protein deacetylase